eukprot:gene6483-9357_t
MTDRCNIPIDTDIPVVLGPTFSKSSDDLKRVLLQWDFKPVSALDNGAIQLDNDNVHVQFNETEAGSFTNMFGHLLSNTTYVLQFDSVKESFILDQVSDVMVVNHQRNAESTPLLNLSEQSTRQTNTISDDSSTSSSSSD